MNGAGHRLESLPVDECCVECSSFGLFVLVLILCSSVLFILQIRQNTCKIYIKADTVVRVGETRLNMWRYE